MALSSSTADLSAVRRSLPARPPIDLSSVADGAPLVSLVVPTWNEAANLRPLFHRIERALHDVPHEILVVDDGSPDGTAAVAEDLARTRFASVRVLRRTGPRGLSYAVADGFAAARGRFLGVIDADLQHDPRVLPELVRSLSDHDLAIGSRYTFAGRCRGWSMLREAQSRLAASLTRRVLGLRVRDPLSGYFMLRREAYACVASRVSRVGWKFLLAILAVDPSMRAAEVGYLFRPRRRGASKMRAGVVGAWFLQLALIVIGRLRGRDGEEAPQAPAPAGAEARA